MIKRPDIKVRYENTTQYLNSTAVLNLITFYSDLTSIPKYSNGVYPHLLFLKYYKTRNEYYITLHGNYILKKRTDIDLKPRINSNSFYRETPTYLLYLQTKDLPKVASYLVDDFFEPENPVGAAIQRYKELKDLPPTVPVVCQIHIIKHWFLLHSSMPRTL